MTVPALAAGLPGRLGVGRLLVALALVAGCGGPEGNAPASPAGASVGPPAVPATASPADRTPAPPSPPATRAARTDAPATATLRDDALLGILPPTVDGVPVRVEAESFADAVRDPAFARTVEAAAFAVAVDGEDLASGVVARLRPGAFSDGMYRDWRETFGEGACGPAGGVTRNAEAEIGGRPVHITTCGGGLTVHHAWLPERGVIVSLFSLGPRRFGERLMAGLRP